MSGKVYRTYEEAAQEYQTQFAQLLTVPKDVSYKAPRGAGDVPVDVLIERSESIADVSAAMTTLAKPTLRTRKRTVREGMSAQLVAQATAEMQLATELLQVAEDQQDVSKAPSKSRAARTADMQNAITMLQETMRQPLSAGLVLSVRKAAGAPPTTLPKAKQVLQEAAKASTQAVSKRVLELGQSITLDLVTNTDWALVSKGAGLLGKDIVDWLEEIQAGASLLVRKALQAVQKLFLSAYDKLLALLGKDAENQARAKVKEWLEQVKTAGQIDLFGKLLDKLYQMSSFEQELPAWLDKTSVGVDVLNQTTQTVTDLADRFNALSKQMSGLKGALGLAGKFKAPQILAVVAGLRVALLTVLIYSGYDYIGYRQGQFLDIVQGVAQVIKNQLAV